MDNEEQEQAPATNGEAPATDEQTDDTPLSKPAQDEDEDVSQKTTDVNETPDAAAAEENDVSATEQKQDDAPDAAEDVADENKAEEEKPDEQEEIPAEKPAAAEAAQPDVVKDVKEAPPSETKEQAQEEVKKEGAPYAETKEHAQEEVKKDGGSSGECEAPAKESKDEDKAEVKEDAAEGAQAMAASSVPTPDVNFTGKWKSVKHDNLEDYLKEMGMNFLMRKIAIRASPTCEMKQDGNHFQVKLTTGFFNQQAEFNIGEEYGTSTPFGEKLKCISHWEDKKLMTKSRPEDESKKGLNQMTTREIIDGELVMTLKVGEVEAKRYFQKVE